MTSGHAGFVAVGGNHDDHLPPDWMMFMITGWSPI